jgi:Tfp pilus assembly protein PilO
VKQGISPAVAVVVILIVVVVVAAVGYFVFMRPKAAQKADTAAQKQGMEKGYQEMQQKAGQMMQEKTSGGGGQGEMSGPAGGLGKGN